MPFFFFFFPSIKSNLLLNREALLSYLYILILLSLFNWQVHLMTVIVKLGWLLYIKFTISSWMCFQSLFYSNRLVNSWRSHHLKVWLGLLEYSSLLTNLPIFLLLLPSKNFWPQVVYFYPVHSLPPGSGLLPTKLWFSVPLLVQAC